MARGRVSKAKDAFVGGVSDFTRSFGQALQVTSGAIERKERRDRKVEAQTLEAQRLNAQIDNFTSEIQARKQREANRLKQDRTSNLLTFVGNKGISSQLRSNAASELGKELGLPVDKAISRTPEKLLPDFFVNSH